MVLLSSQASTVTAARDTLAEEAAGLRGQLAAAQAEARSSQVLDIHETNVFRKIHERTTDCGSCWQAFLAEQLTAAHCSACLSYISCDQT